MRNIFVGIGKRGIIAIIFVVLVLLFFVGKNQVSKPEPPDHGGGEAEIVRILPETNISAPYTIEYITTVEGVDHIKISDSSPSGRQKAIEWLTAQGYEPSSVVIEYDEYTMPLNKVKP